MKNRVNLIGNLGNDVEMKTFENGGKVAKFSLATSESWKNKEGEKQTETQWHNIVVFSRGQNTSLVDLCEKYLEKGSRIDVEGKIKYRTFEKEDGTKSYFTEIHLNSILFLSTKGTNETSNESTSTVNKPTDISENEPDDLPF